MSEKKPKILMIEDNVYLLKIYRNKLTRAGFEFIEATNGEEGLNKVISEKPDLVLLDIILPRKSGFDILIEMKKKKATKNIPVVVLSILGQESDVKRGLALGAQDYLVKTNTSLSGVVKKIKEWLAKKALHQRKNQYPKDGKNNS